ncbi:MAG: acetyl-CoA carboxylase biotin carboxylase subunit [Blastocatellia bacterium]
MFKKILIANRGEIAVRLIRACRDLGISPVAIYSDADRGALHVRLADEAWHLGGSAATESYLAGERIVEIALRCGAEAVHPGYGFLSERGWFARAVEEAGLVFIGPSPATIDLMGDKTNARRAAQRAGAPIVPGTQEPLSDEAAAERMANEIGYPVMLKASAGGGGKGMRVVRTAEELRHAFGLAGAEAGAAFGDSAVYLEKYIEHPRHIEIQIVADRSGRTIHLGERECSIQRRHQKVIEECPASFNDPELRQRMGQAAVEIARAAGYQSVGTVEFLVDAEKNFYFLEMNTRLQVEHPVTEMVTGIDLVCEQIRIAAGEPLSITQEDVRWHGSAIECRIYAEDPDRQFMPSPGRITRLRTPAGPGVRDDSGVYEGWEVPIHYDPMISKLVVWGATRDEAITRLRRALEEYEVGGIRTTIPFFRHVLRDDDFINGNIDTEFISRFVTPTSPPTNESETPLTEKQLIAAIAAAISFTRESRQPTESSRPPVDQQSRWKIAGREALLRR